MRVFLDFEASSLAKNSYPIEVAWVWEDGRSESHLIRPAPDWTDWAEDAEAIHHISRDMLTAGTPHEVVANRMLEVLAGHDLFASAPSWDGKWQSILLRSAGLPRHSLRLRDSDDLFRETASDLLKDVVPAGRLDPIVGDLLAFAEIRHPGRSPLHRALPDAEEERERWLAVWTAARDLARQYGGA